MTPEGKFKKELMQDLKDLFPDSIILKGNSATKQGVPDILVMNEERWASLEVKESATAIHQPNQDYYVDKMNTMSYSAFVYPENKDEVLNELQRSLKPGRKPRVSKRQ